MEIQGFAELTPDYILGSIESTGFRCSGRVLQLNSYENRVFDIELEEGERVIAKFYRAGRWSKEAIQDEHDFLAELHKEGIPAVPPLELKGGGTIAKAGDLFMSIFSKTRGRQPDEFIGDQLKQVGRRLAQIHNVGARKKAAHRVTMDVETFGKPALELLQTWVGPEVRGRYFESAEKILKVLEQKLNSDSFIRIHGDCHKGNLLHSGTEFYFVDFDDFCNGPEVQDIWMLTGGDSEEARTQREILLEGYEELRAFDRSTLSLQEPLRGLRLLHYSAWIAKRWKDPSFPRLFPDFNTYPYWAEEAEELEQIAWRSMNQPS